mmetsp:Transcript_61474/g.84492  ORF Transcript_61474/g.84492 Transcript_61474/m.84492 type:complete len:387 (+) Transcript_61474:3020-4180(+)
MASTRSSAPWRTKGPGWSSSGAQAANRSVRMSLPSSPSSTTVARQRSERDTTSSLLWNMLLLSKNGEMYPVTARPKKAQISGIWSKNAYRSSQLVWFGMHKKSGTNSLSVNFLPKKMQSLVVSPRRARVAMELLDVWFVCLLTMMFWTNLRNSLRSLSSFSSIGAASFSLFANKLRLAILRNGVSALSEVLVLVLLSDTSLKASLLLSVVDVCCVVLLPPPLYWLLCESSRKRLAVSARVVRDSAKAMRTVSSRSKGIFSMAGMMYLGNMSESTAWNPCTCERSLVRTRMALALTDAFSSSAFRNHITVGVRRWSRTSSSLARVPSLSMSWRAMSFSCGLRTWRIDEQTNWMITTKQSSLSSIGRLVSASSTVDTSVSFRSGAGGG